MKMLPSMNPGLAGHVARMGAERARRLCRELVLRTAERFERLPAVVEYARRLGAGEPLGCMPGPAFARLSEQVDADYLEQEARGEPEAVWLPNFFAARYLYALSLIAGCGQGDSPDLDRILYDLAYAHDDEDGFLESVRLGLEAD